MNTIPTSCQRGIIGHQRSFAVSTTCVVPAASNQVTGTQPFLVFTRYGMVVPLRRVLSRMYPCRVLHWHGTVPDARQFGTYGDDGGGDGSDASFLCEKGGEDQRGVLQGWKQARLAAQAQEDNGCEQEGSEGHEAVGGTCISWLELPCSRADDGYDFFNHRTLYQQQIRSTRNSKIWLGACCISIPPSV